MGKSIPFLSAKDINKLEDYERFRNTKAYLLQCSGPIGYGRDKKDQIWKLAHASGYKKFNKFLSHQKEWHDLNRKIPVSYLDEIGVDYEILECTAGLDEEKYERALRVPLYPRGFTIRYMACVYKTVEFPPDTTEYEAREIMLGYAKETGRSCAVNYPDFKTIVAWPKGEIRTVYYKPEIHFKGDYIIPSVHGRDFAQVRIV